MITSLIPYHAWWLQIVILLFMINRWKMKLWINNSTIQILQILEHTSSAIFIIQSKNQSFKDNSNSIKLNTYIHMNVKNSKNKNNNLQKPLPNTVTILLYLFIYLFFSDCAFFSFFFLLCFIKLFLINQNLSHIC